APRAAVRARDFRRGRLADEIHLARIGARLARAAAVGLRAGESRARGPRRAGSSDHHRVQTSIERRAAADRNRAPPRSPRVMRTVAVVGAGSWGTALAVHLGRIGHDVRLWARDPALVDDLSSHRTNAVYLPDIALPDRVSVTHDMRLALRDAELVVSAIPSHGCRDVVRRAAPHLDSRAVIV